MRTVGELVEMIVDWLEPLPVGQRWPGSLGSHPVGIGHPRQIEEGGFEIVFGAISCVEEF